MIATPCYEEYLNIPNTYGLCIKSGNTSKQNYSGIMTSGLPYATGYVYVDGKFCFEYLLQTNRGQTYSLYINTVEVVPEIGSNVLLSLNSSVSFRPSDWCNSILSIYDLKITLHYFNRLLAEYFHSINIEFTVSGRTIEFKNDCSEEIVETALC